MDLEEIQLEKEMKTYKLTGQILDTLPDKEKTPYIGNGAILLHKPAVFILAPYTEGSSDRVVETYVRLSFLPENIREEIKKIFEELEGD